MDTEDVKDLVAICSLLVVRHRRKVKSGKRRMWIHDSLRKRDCSGEFRLIKELQLTCNEDRFQRYFRLSHQQFQDLLKIVAPFISKQPTRMRKPIDPEERLAICLRYLATGDSFGTIASSYRVGKSTVANIVLEGSEAIWTALKNQVLLSPTTDDWLQIADDFKKKWNFPNCVGAIDGKHVVMRAPSNSGSQFFNYKGTHSIVLLAVADANYCFRAVDIGAFGRNSDGGIFSSSTFGMRLQEDALGLPPTSLLQGSEELGFFPHVFVGDEAFPLKKNLMRPYPGRNLTSRMTNFNYRLSRARRVVENAFGIMASQWRIYHRVLDVSADTATCLVKATVALHNFLRLDVMQRGDSFRDADTIIAPGLEDIGRVGANNASMEAFTIRDKYAEYFQSRVGSVPWRSSEVLNIPADRQ